MAKPRWQSNPILTQPLKPFQGDCSLKAYQHQIQKERAAKFLELFEQYGLSPDNLDDALKMVVYLTIEHVTGFQIETPPSRKADTRSVVDDIILMGGIYAAKSDVPARPELDIIRDLAKWNGWRADEKFLKSKRRRYQELKKKTTPEFQRVAKLLRGLRPELEAHLEKLEKK